jgi:hypothetical protein
MTDRRNRNIVVGAPDRRRGGSKAAPRRTLLSLREDADKATVYGWPGSSFTGFFQGVRFAVRHLRVGILDAVSDLPTMGEGGKKDAWAEGNALLHKEGGEK